MPLETSDIETLYERHAQELLRFFVARTLQPDAAVELLAETFAAAFLVRASFRGESDTTARAWLWGIAQNLLREYFRRGRVHRQALDRIGVEPQTLTDEEYDRVENAIAASSLRRVLAQELRALPREQRDALRLRIVDERPYPDVARLLGISEQTARARVSRALRALRGSPAINKTREANEDG